jgi:hypothetical protein
MERAVHRLWTALRPFNDTPSIAWTGSSVVITASGAGVYYWWQAAGNNVWHPETVS